MSATQTGTKRPGSPEERVEEPKKVAIWDKDSCKSAQDGGEHEEKKPEDPPTRNGVQVDIVTQDSDKLLQFLVKAIGGREYFRFKEESGKILHLAVDIGGVSAFTADKGNAFDKGEGDKYVRLNLHTPEPEVLGEKMVKAGSTVVLPCEKQFWGSTYGQYKDPFGQVWTLCTPSSPAQDIPEPLRRKVVPFISVKNADAYIAFLKDTLGAEPLGPVAKTPEGKVMCQELILNGGGLIMVGDHFDDSEGAVVNIILGLEHGQAAKVAKEFEVNGGEIVDPPSLKFWGQVFGKCKDPLGVTWCLSEPEVAEYNEEEKAIDVRLGAKHAWKWSWGVEDVPRMCFYGEVRSVDKKEIEDAMSDMMPAAHGAACKAGATITGHPGAIYYTWDEGEGGNTRITCGPMIAEGMPEVEGDGVGSRSVGGGKYATVTHVGPYNGLKKAWESLFEWAAGKGHELVMPGFELYENSPTDVDASKLRTKVHITIKDKSPPSGAAPTAPSG